MPGRNRKCCNHFALRSVGGFKGLGIFKQDRRAQKAASSSFTHSDRPEQSAGGDVESAFVPVSL